MAGIMAVVSGVASSSTIFIPPRTPGLSQSSLPTSLSLRRVPSLARSQRRLYDLESEFGRHIRSRSPVAAQASLQEMDVGKVVPQADRVLVKLEELPEKSVGGVLLPKSAVKFEHYLCGEVLSVGKEAGVVSKGQKVLFSDLNAYEVSLGIPEKLCFVRSGDLLAVVE